MFIDQLAQLSGAVSKRKHVAALIYIVVYHGIWSLGVTALLHALKNSGLNQYKIFLLFIWQSRLGKANFDCNDITV